MVSNILSSNIFDLLKFRVYLRAAVYQDILYFFSLFSASFLLFIAHHNLIKKRFVRSSKETEGYKAEIHEMTLSKKNNVYVIMSRDF